VAYINKKKNGYCHCLIYLENGRVIHVKKTLSGLGILRATIVEEKLEDVIKDNDLVIPGHKIEEIQTSANLSDKILERAKACIDPPMIFDYDLKWVSS